MMRVKEKNQHCIGKVIVMFMYVIGNFVASIETHDSVSKSSPNLIQAWMTMLRDVNDWDEI